MPDSPRKRMHKRTHSDEYITGLLGSDPKRNRNVEWLNTPYLLPAYIFFIALFYGAKPAHSKFKPKLEPWLTGKVIFNCGFTVTL